MLIELEAKIEALDGVLGCVILTAGDGNPAEIQAFTRVGTDLQAVRQAVVDEVAKTGLQRSLEKVFVFELEAESHFGDRESLERAAELAEQEARSRGPLSTVEPPKAKPSPPPKKGGKAGSKSRPVLRRVVLGSSPTGGNSEAEVVLGGVDNEVVGRARGDKTPHGLKVLAQATLEAAGRLVPDVEFILTGASLVTAIGREAVIVIVQDEDLETVGAAMVRAGPISEATVRATLDAINRRLADL
jgi:hypothetical protein